MSAVNLLTSEYLKECFRYEDGRLYWLERPVSHFKTEDSWRRWVSRELGQEAGCISRGESGDRWKVGLNDKLFFRYRIIWAMFNGAWPRLMELSHLGCESFRSLATCLPWR